MSRFPELPIVTPDPPRKTQTEKYGGLLYLSLAGLAILILLITWFGAGVWSLREIWADVYVLNDPKKPEVQRVNAAFRLAENPEVSQRQRWDLTMSRVPPDLGRYVLAESMGSELVNDNPRAYAIAVTRSEGWPDWLRLLLTRPLAVAASEGTPIDEPSIRELAKSPDPTIRLFCDYALAVQTRPQSESRVEAIKNLEAARSGDFRDFAGALLQSLNSAQPERAEHLRRATQLIRSTHPEIVPLWNGWLERPDGFVRAE